MYRYQIKLKFISCTKRSYIKQEALNVFRKECDSNYTYRYMNINCINVKVQTIDAHGLVTTD